MIKVEPMAMKEMKSVQKSTKMNDSTIIERVYKGKTASTRITTVLMKKMIPMILV